LESFYGPIQVRRVAGHLEALIEKVAKRAEPFSKFDLVCVRGTNAVHQCFLHRHVDAPLDAKNSLSKISGVYEAAGK
jgi:hypothetical protein